MVDDTRSVIGLGIFGVILFFVGFHLLGTASTDPTHIIFGGGLAMIIGGVIAFIVVIKQFT